MTPFPAPSSSPLTLWPHVGCLSPQTSCPVDRNSWSPPLCFWGLVFRESCPGFLSPPPPLVLVFPGPLWGSASHCVHSASLWPLPLAAEALPLPVSVSALSLVLLFPSCSLPPSWLPLPPTYPDCPPGPALFLLATPPSHSQLCHFFPHGMEVLGRRTPESQSSRASVPAPLCGHYLLTSPASPALVCNAKKEPANPQFPPTGPKRSQFVTSLFLILLFSPSFPPPFCWALSIGQKCYSLI